jgi:hypothetical protein
VGARQRDESTYLHLVDDAVPLVGSQAAHVVLRAGTVRQLERSGGSCGVVQQALTRKVQAVLVEVQHLA